uniref:Uncharacterized protein n=1 Tax=Meloidogyne enterolobii TaxID=390850 RepID=A0A6V7TTN9_MELEN|nr:unnamed protein product [Meloidogyne enterolobii]
MVHTFPSTRSRPTDPLFFDLFGDIFQPNKKQNNLNSSNNLLFKTLPNTNNKLIIILGREIMLSENSNKII